MIQPVHKLLLAKMDFNISALEFVRRFYREAVCPFRQCQVPPTQWYGKYIGVGNAQDFYPHAAAFGLVRFPNGGAVAPAPDDIVAFSTATADLGHVAIVRSIDTSMCSGVDSAEFTVQLIEQNTNRPHQLIGQCQLQPSGNYTYTLIPRSIPIQGWLRVPGSASTNAGSTAIITGIVNGQAVDKAYVPIPASGAVAALNIDSQNSTGALVKTIAMPSGFAPNATAANQGTNQVVVVSYTSPTVQIIDATQDNLVASLTSSVSSFASFSGGSCMICGVLVDPSTNSAILDTAQGYLILDLTTKQFSAFIPGTVAGENFGLNLNSRTVLNPTYFQGIPAGLQAIRLTDNSVFTYSSSIGEFPDAVAIDSATGIAVVPDEFTGNQYLINLQAEAFSAPNFSAPSSVFPINFTDCGGERNDWSLVSAEASTHRLFLATEFADCAAVEPLPSAAVLGVPPLPTLFRWGHMPSAPDGLAWNNGGDPHGIAVFTSVINGKVYGFLIRSDRAWVARIDLQGASNAAQIPGGLQGEIDLTPFVSFLRTQ